MATGSLGGVSANVLVMLSRQNCIRSDPIVGFETISGIRAISMLKARRARYAGRAGGGMNIWSVYDNESNFLFTISHRTYCFKDGMVFTARDWSSMTAQRRHLPPLS